MVLRESSAVVHASSDARCKRDAITIALLSALLSALLPALIKLALIRPVNMVNALSPYAINWTHCFRCSFFKSMFNSIIALPYLPSKTASGTDAILRRANVTLGTEHEYALYRGWEHWGKGVRLNYLEQSMRSKEGWERKRGKNRKRRTREGEKDGRLCML